TAAVAMGTRFVASDECDAHPRYKARLLEAAGRDTVLTELFEVGCLRPIACSATAHTSAGRPAGARHQGGARRGRGGCPGHTALRGPQGHSRGPGGPAR